MNLPRHHLISAAVISLISFSLWLLVRDTIPDQNPTNRKHQHGDSMKSGQPNSKVEPRTRSLRTPRGGPKTDFLKTIEEIIASYSSNISAPKKNSISYVIRGEPYQLRKIISINEFHRGFNLIKKSELLNGDEIIADYLSFFSPIYPNEVITTALSNQIGSKNRSKILITVGHHHPILVLPEIDRLGATKEGKAIFTMLVNRSPAEAATWLNENQSTTARSAYIDILVNHLVAKGLKEESEDWLSAK